MYLLVFERDIMVFINILKKILRIFLLLFISCTLILAYMFLEPYWLTVKHVKIKDKDIPDSFAGKKMVFVADIHHGDHFSRERLSKLVEKINSLEPDIILLGGDFIGKGSHYIKPCFEELKKLEAPLGKYGVLGNHDHYTSDEITRENMRKAGIAVLDNDARWIVYGGGRIKVGGVGDYYHSTQWIEPTIEDVREEDFVILLSHNPDYAEEIQNHKVDMVLSGHTHGGQVTFFGLWAPYIPSRYGQKYRYGMVETEYTKVYVTSGVGCTGYAVRFFARPEICLIELAN
jgi:predicted MPP superfamily phosphohydrolase